MTRYKQKKATPTQRDGSKAGTIVKSGLVEKRGKKSAGVKEVQEKKLWMSILLEKNERAPPKILGLFNLSQKKGGDGEGPKMGLRTLSFALQLSGA